MKKNIFKLLFFLYIMIMSNGCLSLLIINSKCPDPPPFSGLPEKYKSWRIGHYDFNSSIDSIGFLFLNYEISQIPDLEKIIRKDILERLQKNDIDYSNNIYFYVRVFCRDYERIDYAFNSFSLHIDNQILNLSNYLIYKNIEQSVVGDNYGSLNLLGKLSKDEFIQITKSKKVLLEFKSIDEHYSLKFKDLRVYEDTFLVE